MSEIFYAKIPDALRKSPYFTLAAKNIYTCLHGYSREKDLKKPMKAQVSAGTIADELNITTTTIFGGLRELKKSGWITIERQGRMKANIYYLYGESLHTLETKKRMENIRLRVQRDQALARKLRGNLTISTRSDAKERDAGYLERLKLEEADEIRRPFCKLTVVDLKALEETSKQLEKDTTNLKRKKRCVI